MISCSLADFLSKTNSNRDNGMNIQEYKERKDKLRCDIGKLINDFNKETGTVVNRLDVDITNIETMGEKKKILNIWCKITTDIDE